MRGKLFYLVALLSAMLFGFGHATSGNAAPRPNLAVNPSFESAGGLNGPQGWHFVAEDGSQTTGVWDTSVVHSGSHSLRLTSAIDYNGSQCFPDSGYWETDAPITLNPHSVYYISAWNRSDQVGALTGAPAIAIDYLDASGNTIFLDAAVLAQASQVPGWQA